jgi:preprotein translocase subunit SecA
MKDIEAGMKTLLPSDMDMTGRLAVISTSMEGKEDIAAKRTELIEGLMSSARQAYAKIEALMGDIVRMEDIEKSLLIHAIDMLWVEHLDSMDHLRKGIGLQGYGQRDPLVEYKREAFRMFNELLSTIDKQVANAIFKVQIAREMVGQDSQNQLRGMHGLQFSGPAKDMDKRSVTNSVSTTSSDKRFENIGRNDLCPCGSGKKFKKCHGA